MTRRPTLARLRPAIVPLLPDRSLPPIVATRRKLGKLLARPRWGNLDRDEPFSASYGADRGTPADRRYLQEFLRANAGAVRGRVLEVERPEWTAFLGAGDGHSGRIASLTVCDLDPRNTRADLVTDLCGDDPFGDRRFDCEIVVQTLQYLPDPAKALRSLWRALDPGGTLLVTVPGIARVDDMLGESGDLWHFTPAGLRTLLGGTLVGARVEVAGYGSLQSAAGFLYGIAAEEMPRAYRRNDRRFPVVACAAAVKEDP